MDIADHLGDAVLADLPPLHDPVRGKDVDVKPLLNPDNVSELAMSESEVEEVPSDDVEEFEPAREPPMVVPPTRR